MGLSGSKSSACAQAAAVCSHSGYAGSPSVEPHVLLSKGAPQFGAALSEALCRGPAELGDGESPRPGHPLPGERFSASTSRSVTPSCSSSSSSCAPRAPPPSRTVTLREAEPAGAGRTVQIELIEGQPAAAALRRAQEALELGDGLSVGVTDTRDRAVELTFEGAGEGAELLLWAGCVSAIERELAQARVSEERARNAVYALITERDVLQMELEMLRSRQEAD
eukprot:TRINITY_DN31000_c0_g1_i1.p2 TRINITY_DN31000_c0_g1~~TRINITY_DN31000_c0_g1_i1.p2  ORF type:complete len:251 (+),score=85.60 TRINITY_DN31000_c0_g1_i1:85-753(+)